MSTTKRDDTKYLVLSIVMAIVVVVAVVIMAWEPAKAVDDGGDDTGDALPDVLWPPAWPELASDEHRMISGIAFSEERSGVALKSTAFFTTLNVTESNFTKLRFCYCNYQPGSLMAAASIYEVNGAGTPTTVIASSEAFEIPVTGPRNYTIVDSPYFNTTLAVGQVYAFVIEISPADLTSEIVIPITQSYDSNISLRISQGFKYYDMDENRYKWRNALDEEGSRSVVDVMPIMT